MRGSPGPVDMAFSGPILRKANIAGAEDLDAASAAPGFHLELARQQAIPIVDQELTRYDLYTAEECFLTGTAAEVIPAVQLDRRLIGNGHPGPITLKLVDSFRQLTRATGTPIYQ